jgi:hypothetical protein
VLGSVRDLDEGFIARKFKLCLVDGAKMDFF